MFFYARIKRDALFKNNYYFIEFDYLYNKKIILFILIFLNF
jgi:hypothetical protein